MAGRELIVSTLVRAPLGLALCFGFPELTLAQFTTLAPGGFHVSTIPTVETRGANTGPFTATFTVSNTGSTTITGITLACSRTGPVTCGTVNPTLRGSLAGGASFDVSVGYSVGSPGTGTLRLTATDDFGTSAWGERNITVATPPSVTIVAPVITTGNRAVVRSRQPLIRALFLPGTAPFDTTKTQLLWRGVNITGLARHNRGLLEWEVDSTNWLAVGDSAEISVKACDQYSGCTTVTRWAVLENDQKPVLGFTGMPLETSGRAFTAPFGPGISVNGAEVETGFSIPSYVSMGASRSAGLVYSTRQSYPRALVHLDLELPWPAGTPDEVKLVLLDGVVRLDSLVLATPTCLTGALKRCRATLQGDFAASSFTTPTRKWLTVEASVTSGGITRTGTDSVEAVIVDRRTTRYGSGWWPAGVLSVVGAGSDRVLVGANGTATIYRGHGDSVYVPPPGVFVALVRTGTGWELQPRGSLAKMLFDSQGRLVSSIDQNGNRDSVAYSGTTDQVTSFIDPLGKTITLGYNGNARIATFTDPGGRQSKVTVNSTNHKLTYDSLSSPATKSNRTTFIYRDYPGTGTMVLLKRIGVLLDTTIVKYDSTFRRRPDEVRLPLVQDETGAAVTPRIRYVAYESRGMGTLVSLDSVYVELKDPRLFSTRSLLNRWGQARKTWDAKGTISTSSYNAEGFVLWTEGKNGDSSRVFTDYDAYLRPVRSWITRGGSVLRLDSLVYDANHRVVKRIDPLNQFDSLSYDLKGNVVATRDKGGFVGRIAYRSDGLPDSSQATGETDYRRFTYDATWKNLAQVMDQVNQVSAKFAFDEVGRDTTVDRRVRVKVSGTTTTYQWRRNRSYRNEANQADSVVLFRSVNCQTCLTTPPSPWPAASDTLMTQRVGHLFDRAGRDSLRINSRGKAALYLYDRLGRLLSRHPLTDSMAVVDSMAYDVAGNLKKTITRRGDVITTNYDSRNRDTLTVIPGIGTLRKAFGGAQDQLTRLWYDSPTDPVGGVNAELRWGYDARGRLVADSSYGGTIAHGTTYTYDTYERQRTMVDPLGTWTTGYEGQRGYADTLITPFTDTVQVARDGRGRVTATLVHGTGVHFNRTASWTVTNELNTLTHFVNSSPSYDAGHFDRVGEINLEPEGSGGAALGPLWTEQRGPSGSIDSLQDTVRYDGWERARKWVALKKKGFVASDSFDFDRSGNLFTPGGGETYDGPTDRLTSRMDAGLTRTYTYDRAGNLVSTTRDGITTTYAYDALNRLVSVSQGGVLIARYGYDVLGRRIVKRVYSSVTGGTVAYTRFVYHGDQVAFETDSSGTTGWQYTWGPGSDELVAAVHGPTAQHYYTVRDKLGSVRGLIKRDGSWVFNESFWPYGARFAFVGTSTIGLRYRWTGREYDPETGWYFHRTRYYDPGGRRFVQEDQIGYAGGANLYAYVAGRPLEAKDPDGREMCEPWSCAGASAGSPFAGDGLTEIRGGGGSWYHAFGETLADFTIGQAEAAYDTWAAAGGGTAVYYDNYGRVIRRERSGGTAHYLVHNGQTYALDYGLRQGATPYALSLDPSMFDVQAIALARLAPGYDSWVEVSLNSLPGGSLDFKRSLPDRALYNAGNGLLTHKHAVGNTAWGYYMRSQGFSLSTALRGAYIQGGFRGGEDLLDQTMIRRGYGLSGE